MKSIIRYLLLMLLLGVIFTLWPKSQIKPIDWTPTFQNGDKIPFGTYVLYHRLHDIFPATRITPSKRPVYNALDTGNGAPSAYVVICNRFDPTATDLRKLFDFLKKGNAVFIASSEWGTEVTKQWHFNPGFPSMLLQNDSGSVAMVNKDSSLGDRFYLPGNSLASHFEVYRSDGWVVLGRSAAHRPDFIVKKVGSGRIFLHACPAAFSNYFMLHRQNNRYTAAALSFLPVKTSSLIWDEYYHPIRATFASPLAYILSNGYLRAAYLTALSGFLLFMIFGSKRNQRMIPIIAPIKNDTIAFIETIGLLYFERHDNKNLFNKMRVQWADLLRNQLFIAYNPEEPESLKKSIVLKTGLEERFVNGFLNKIQYLESQPTISDNDLLDFQTMLTEFNKVLRISRTPIAQ